MATLCVFIYKSVCLYGNAIIIVDETPKYCDILAKHTDIHYSTIAIVNVNLLLLWIHLWTLFTLQFTISE